MKKKYYITFGVILSVCILLPILWYTIPYGYRKIFYLTFDEGVYENVLVVKDFDISQNGFVGEYDLKNNYVMPMNIEFRFTELPNGIPSIKNFPWPPPLYLNLQISAEILINDKVRVHTIGEDKPSVGYSMSAQSGTITTYIYLLRIDYPTQLRFSKDAKIRITIMETDEILQGSKGDLIITPHYRL